jgi:C4-dicarboxylate-specific signal transduction histidine kinase
MRKLLFASFLLLVGIESKAQTEFEIKDTININAVDSIILEGAPKSKFGDKVNKMFGWGREEEIEKLTKQVKIQREIIDSMSVMVSNTRIVIKNVPNLSPDAVKSIKKDEKFIKDLPKSYNSLNKDEIARVTKEIDSKIEELIRQRDSLVNSGGDQDLIDAKGNIIESLEREKKVINLSDESNELKDENHVLSDENVDLKIKENKLKRYLYISLGALFILALIVSIYLQRKTIKVQDVEIENQLKDIGKKNTYLEHAAKIIRHDMHSGINTYMPRGISSLEKTLSDEEAKKLKIYNAIKMIKEGLMHTQKVYKSVYEFTNLVKQNVVLDKKELDLKDILSKYISNTSYKSQVQIEDLTTANVNETLFCNAIDNLIKNGLKYNDSDSKLVKIYMEGNDLIVQDNGRGMTQKQFENICFSYSKKNTDTDSKGLGLNICLAILDEHGFNMTCEKNQIGTKIKINIKNDRINSIS